MAVVYYGIMVLGDGWSLLAEKIITTLYGENEGVGVVVISPGTKSQKIYPAFNPQMFVSELSNDLQLAIEVKPNLEFLKP